MVSASDIETLRRRTTAIERELAAVKLRLAELERVGIGGETEAPVTARGHGAQAPALVAPPAQPELPAEPVTPPSLVVPPVLSTVTPAEAPRAAFRETPAAVRPPPWREWLEPLQLWPPSGEDNAEIRLGAWWATRIGALLAVIGVVFLGVYVSRDSAPWVRLAEVMAVTAGVIGLGGWLERKLPLFGAVVFGAGLALAYFCAFAAYAVPPMKVIERQDTATLCELAVVAGIFGAAWWRGSSVVAAMAVVLGHVTAFLALRAGPEGFGPWVILLLGAAAVLLRLARGWTAPSALAMPLAWLYLGVAATQGATGAGAMTVVAAWVWCALYFVLFWMRDWIVVWRGGDLSRVDRTVQVANSSLAFAVGLLATAQVGGDRLAQFYFGAGTLMLAATIAWRVRPAGAPLVSIFACKAAGLLGLGVIAAWEGHARYLVLLTQAFALLVSARQSGVRGLRTATVIAGAVALGFFLAQLRPGGAPVAQTGTALEIVFLLGAAGFVAALRRWLGFAPFTAAFGSVVVGLAAVSTVLSWETHGWDTAVLVGVGAGLAATAWLLRGGEVAAVLGGVVGVAAHAAIWGLSSPSTGVTVLWLNEAVLLIAAAVGIGVRWRVVPEGAEGRWRTLDFGLAGLSLGTLTVVGFRGFPAATGLALAAGLGAVLAFASRGRVRQWGELISPLLALGLFLYFLKFGGRAGAGWLGSAAMASWLAAAWWAKRTAGEKPNAWRAANAALATAVTLVALVRWVPAEWRLLCAAGVALAVFVLAWQPRVAGALASSWAIWVAAAFWQLGRGPSLVDAVACLLAWAPAAAMVRGIHAAGADANTGRAVPVQVTLASVIGLFAALSVHDPAGRLLALGVLGLAAFAAWKWGRVEPARGALAATATVMWILGIASAGSPAMKGWSAGLAVVCGAGVVLAAWPLLASAGLERQLKQRWQWAGAVAGLVLVFWALAVQPVPVRDYATVGWGAIAVALFLAGLFARSRPHRLVGLAGLGACVLRAFAVDIDSTLYRIVAFVALGCVLLWVGFSYHRFRHLIADEEKKL